MIPNLPKTKEDKDTQGLLLACECHGRHYLEVVEWDESGGAQLLFGEQPIGFWRSVRNWWKHRSNYYCDIVLNPNDIKALIVKLKEYEDKYERTKQTVAALERKVTEQRKQSGFRREQRRLKLTKEW